MKFHKHILLVSLLLFHVVLYSQNYVENPSFEKLNGCPTDFFQIYKATPWFSPNCEPLRPDRHGYAILFTGGGGCGNDLTGVPRNVWCVQDAHSGVSYAAIAAKSAKLLGFSYRQYIETKLKQPLEAGKKYFVSAFYSLCYYEKVSPDIICFKTDGLGAYFSANIVDKNPECYPLQLQPQVYSDSKQISPGPEWYELTGCITAAGNEQYLTIGNFADNVSSNCAPVDSISYYLLMDDISVIPEVKKDIDTVLCNGNDWTINTTELREEYSTLTGWEYQWSDGSTDTERTFTTPGTYTLTVTNADCFANVYNFKIAFGNCDCKDYIPNTFTPNGDNLNDKFIPHIICETQQVSGYRFSIFDRWGKRIFFTTSGTQAWDGTYLGQPVASGEYVYLLQYRNGLLQDIKTVTGTVMVVR